MAKVIKLSEEKNSVCIYLDPHIKEWFKKESKKFKNMPTFVLKILSEIEETT